jgi:NADPH:quinone reductase-like Zn-dependent oxidoreductase
MKAAVLRAPGGLDRIEVQNIPDPGQPGPGQIRIALHATSLNYHDLLVANGGIPTADGRVLMSDGAGVVEAVGEGVAEFRRGDHVVSCFFPQWQDGLPRGAMGGDLTGTPGDGIDGFAAQFSVRAATAFTHAPRGWSHAEAATITTAGVTAWRALVGDGQIKAGDTVLVLGTGGVSIPALQIAKMTGAAVIATLSSDEKLERVRALGADHVINYRQVPDWGKRVRDLTGGGVDHVVEAGGPGTLAQSIAAVRVGGHISLIGVLTGLQGEVPTVDLLAKQARLQGLMVGSGRQQQDYVAALEQSGVRPVLDSSFYLDQLADAFRYQASGAHFGKVAVEW